MYCQEGRELDVGDCTNFAVHLAQNMLVPHMRKFGRKEKNEANSITIGEGSSYQPIYSPILSN